MSNKYYVKVNIVRDKNNNATLVCKLFANRRNSNLAIIGHKYCIAVNTDLNRLLNIMLPKLNIALDDVAYAGCVKLWNKYNPSNTIPHPT